MITASGKTYTLRNILSEVREQTETGRQLEKNLMMLTIDLLLREKETLQDE